MRTHEKEGMNPQSLKDRKTSASLEPLTPTDLEM